MSILPKSSFEFSKADYWEAFFKQKTQEKNFEWYGAYPELSLFLHKYIKPKDKTLVVGCGNSRLSADLYDVGYKNIWNIDTSKTVIKQMKAANISQRPNMSFEEMNALEMTFESDTFNVVLDKGTLDALMPDENLTTQSNITKYFDEIGRVLRIGGRYVLISLLQVHIIGFLLKYFMEKAWMIRVCRCFDVENKTHEERGLKPLPVFFVVCTKFKKMEGSKSILEMCLSQDAPATRIATPQNIIDSVVELQQLAMVCSGLQRSTSGGKEIVLDVGKPNEELTRYSIHIVDNQKALESKRGIRSYAAFIVPQGRETEWAFGSPEGRQFLACETQVDRLVVVTLNRGHKFDSMDEIKTELSPIVNDFAPLNYNKKIMFLSDGGDLGVRNEVYKGNSPISGKYVIEEVQTGNQEGNIVRRLYFLSAKNIIQSEAKIRKVKSRKGFERVVVDTSSLSCNHHAFMCVGACSALESNLENKLLVIGLGGGSLCSYLRKVFPKSRVTAVELDEEMLKVATGYFGLVEDKHLIVYIKDGLEFINDAVNKRQSYDVVMFDVDSKNFTGGLSCPPASFLEPKLLEKVKTILSPGGVFILNLVCRNTVLCSEVYNKVENLFPTVGSIKQDDDLNEIIFCYKKQKLDFKSIICKGSEKFSNIIQQKKLEKIDCIELGQMMNLLNLGNKK